MNEEYIRKLSRLSLLLFDVDGVMTDGGLVFAPNGKELKIFNSKDGFGIKLLQLGGVRAGIVTGRTSEALLHRCRNLKIDLIYDGIEIKVDILPQILDRTGMEPDAIGFMGDDLLDLGLMRELGAKFAPADAHPMVRSEADFVATSPGGRGAVREVCEEILKAKGVWESVISKYVSASASIR